ncbi:LysR family transcriptional regulator [Rhizobiaceae bacterium CRRU44]|uniref:LysR family transcriptional regulator n=2 Tax=Ferranicluibacter rubi TaxID=2715133 RepID=A0AA43ZIU6_9HYPH|nr:LysR family transcriptional regulator [Ferranicluibacter rubi]
MDRLGAMSMLIEVVESGSFSAAARRLRIPLTTVARKISDLESALGAKLMIRTTRKLSLTDAGITYVATARRIIDQVNEAEREVAGEFTVPRGDLVITAPIQFGQLHVLPIVTDFLALFPEINIRLLLLDQNVQLVNDHVDMAVRIGKLADSALISTSIGAMRTVICASPRLLAVHGVPTTIADLQRMPCVTFEGPGPLSGWNLTDPRTKTPVIVPVTTRLSVTTVEAAVRGALLHVGITRLLHYQVAGAVKAGALKIVLEPFEPVPAPVSVVHAAQGQMPLKMRRFMDFSIPKLRQGLLEFLDAKTER